MDDHDSWILLPAAVKRVETTLDIPTKEARQWILERGMRGALDGRIGIEAGGILGPDRNKPIYPEGWREFADLEGIWWETGNREFEDTTFAYLGIQIHTGDLAVHLASLTQHQSLTDVSNRVDEAPGRREPKPSLPQSRLAEWGRLFLDAHPNPTEAEARRAVDAMFPAHSVTRERLRRILPDRRRGRPLKNKD